MNPTPVPKQGAVLSGGAAYAAYEVGVLKALTRGESNVTGYAPLEIDILAGTSAGSLNAAIMASRPGEASARTASYLESVWLDRLAGGPGRCGNGAFRNRADLTRLFDPSCYLGNPLRPVAELARDTATLARSFFYRTLDAAFSGAPLARRAAEFIDVSAFLSTEPFRDLLREVVDLDGIRRSGKPLRIAATNWQTGSLELFDNADMTEQAGHDVILASSAFPGLPPVYVNGKPYADGGFVLDTPLKPAVFAGADILHVIYLDPDTGNIPLRQFQNAIDVLDRSLNIFKAAILNRDVECAKDVNLGLLLIGNPGAATRLTWDQKKSLARFAGQYQQHGNDPNPIRLVTVHRYHPRDDLGGVLGLLNFDRDHLAYLVERGFDDAVQHDCRASGCILPDRLLEESIAPQHPEGTPP